MTPRFSLTESSSTTNPKWTMIGAFTNFSGVEWTSKYLMCFRSKNTAFKFLSRLEGRTWNCDLLMTVEWGHDILPKRCGENFARNSQFWQTLWKCLTFSQLLSCGLLYWKSAYNERTYSVEASKKNHFATNNCKQYCHDWIIDLKVHTHTHICGSLMLIWILTLALVTSVSLFPPSGSLMKSLGSYEMPKDLKSKFLNFGASFAN